MWDWLFITLFVATSLQEIANRVADNDAVDRCAFCPRPAPNGWALTAQAVDGSWRREILALCTRCDALIREAGDKGLVLKATGERWFGGHRVGRFPAKGIR